MGSAFFGGDQEVAEPPSITHRPNHGWTQNSPGGIPFDTNTTYRKYSRLLEVDGSPGLRDAKRTPELFASAFPAAGYPAPARSCRTAGQPAGRRSTYPLVLTSFRVIQLIGPKIATSQATSRQPDPFMEVHPETAEAAGVAEGEWLIWKTRRGASVCGQRSIRLYTPRRVRTLWVVAGSELTFWVSRPWRKNSANQNLLIGSRHIDPLSGSIPHRSTRCRLVAN